MPQVISPKPAPLPQSFYANQTLSVAQALLGKKLVRTINGQIMSGMVVETEAYLGQNDSASHSYKGLTPRTTVMFGTPGRAYVYFIYGLHYMFNVVTEAEGKPGAVLIRGLEPLEGQDLMQVHRPKPLKLLTNGPAKLCQALAIDKALNGQSISSGKDVWLESYAAISLAQISTGPRIGIAYAKTEDQLAPWRFWIKDNPFISC